VGPPDPRVLLHHVGRGAELVDREEGLGGPPARSPPHDPSAPGRPGSGRSSAWPPAGLRNPASWPPMLPRARPARATIPGSGQGPVRGPRASSQVPSDQLGEGAVAPSSSLHGDRLVAAWASSIRPGPKQMAGVPETLKARPPPRPSSPPPSAPAPPPPAPPQRLHERVIVAGTSLPSWSQQDRDSASSDGTTLRNLAQQVLHLRTDRGLPSRPAGCAAPAPAGRTRDRRTAPFRLRWCRHGWNRGPGAGGGTGPTGSPRSRRGGPGTARRAGSRPRRAPVAIRGPPDRGSRRGSRRIPCGRA
jgi:hypothetical protein